MNLARVPLAIRAALVLLLVAVLFLWHVLGNQYSTAIFADNESFIGPVMAHMSAVLRAGEWPLWMNAVLGGAPLYNLTQLTPFYPGYFLLLPCFSDPLQVLHAMHWLTLLHVFVFLVNSFILMRTLRLSFWAALAGAVLMSLNTNTVSYGGWLQIVAPYAWLPLYVAGLLRVLQEPQSRSSAAVMLLAILMLVFASPSQPLIHAVFLTVFLTGFHVLRQGWNRVLLPTMLQLIVVGAVALLALMLAAPVLLPATLEFNDMIRWIGDAPPVYGNDKIPFEFFLTGQVPLANWPGVLFPGQGGKVIGSIYVGALPVVLALTALIGKYRQYDGAQSSYAWVRWPLLLVAVYSLLSGFGDQLGMAQLNYQLPLLNKIREPGRFLTLFHFSVAILAAMGIDKLAGSSRKQAAVAGGLAAAVVALQWVLVPIQAPPITYSDYYTHNLPLLDAALARIAELDPAHEYRVIYDGKVDKQAASMLASYRGIRSLNAYFNPAPRRQFEEVYYHVRRSDSYFQDLGARYLLCQDCSDETVQGYQRVDSVNGYDIYDIPGALPHFYVAGEVACKPTLSQEKNNRFDLELTCGTSGTLVLNEYYSDAWAAALDGQWQPLAKVNGNQIGVSFPAGTHHVRFVYHPPNFYLGLKIAIAGLVVAAVFFLCLPALLRVPEQMLVYVLVGLLSAAVDVGLMKLLLELGSATVVAVTAAFLVTLIVNYVCHQRLTFRADHDHATFGRYLVVVGVNYGLTLACVWLGVRLFDSPMLGKLVSLPLITLTGFLLGKFWIFQRPRSQT